MANLIEFETKRLLLRQWLPADCEPFVVLNTDPKGMKYFPSLLPRAESDAMADRCQSLIEEYGWGFWAAEWKATRVFIGFVGLHTPSAELPFSPCIEVGGVLRFSIGTKGLLRKPLRRLLASVYKCSRYKKPYPSPRPATADIVPLWSVWVCGSLAPLSIPIFRKALVCVSIFCTACREQVMPHNPALNLVRFVHQTLRDKSAQYRLASR